MRLTVEVGCAWSDLVEVGSTVSLMVLTSSETMRAKRHCPWNPEPAPLLIQDVLLHHCFEHLQGPIWLLALLTGAD